MKKKVLFYYLSAFSQTGGIEKFNRCFIKALDEIDPVSFDCSVLSAYDHKKDSRYNQTVPFKGFNKKRWQSVLSVIKQSYKTDVLVLGHINLAIAGAVVKLLNPRCKVVMITHGIEVWKKLVFIKRWMLRKSDVILSVSNYTKNQLVLRNKIDPKKIKIFPNTLDPQFKIPEVFEKPQYLLERYGLQKNAKVILTLSRLSSSEQEKGYDRVITALPQIIKEVPDAVYILAGKYDETEKKRITQLAASHNASGKIILTGFVIDAEVSDHYLLADVFIMPSRKEGFGIVFLEAIACGAAVVGGNQDGTVDALKNGAFGSLINPGSIGEISSTLIDILQSDEGKERKTNLQHQVIEQYHFSRYKERLLNSLSTYAN